MLGNQNSVKLVIKDYVHAAKAFVEGGYRYAYALESKIYESEAEASTIMDKLKLICHESKLLN